MCGGVVEKKKRSKVIIHLLQNNFTVSPSSKIEKICVEFSYLIQDHFFITDV